MNCKLLAIWTSIILILWIILFYIINTEKIGEIKETFVTYAKQCRTRWVSGCGKNCRKNICENAGGTFEHNPPGPYMCNYTDQNATCPSGFYDVNNPKKTCIAPQTSNAYMTDNLEENCRYVGGTFTDNGNGNYECIVQTDTCPIGFQDSTDENNTNESSQLNQNSTVLNYQMNELTKNYESIDDLDGQLETNTRKLNLLTQQTNELNRIAFVFKYITIISISLLILMICIFVLNFDHINGPSAVARSKASSLLKRLKAKRTKSII